MSQKKTAIAKQPAVSAWLKANEPVAREDAPHGGPSTLEYALWSAKGNLASLLREERIGQAYLPAAEVVQKQEIAAGDALALSADRDRFTTDMAALFDEEDRLVAQLEAHRARIGERVAETVEAAKALAARRAEEGLPLPVAFPARRLAGQGPSALSMWEPEEGLRSWVARVRSFVPGFKPDERELRRRQIAVTNARADLEERHRKAEAELREREEREAEYQQQKKDAAERAARSEREWAQKVAQHEGRLNELADAQQAREAAAERQA